LGRKTAPGSIESTVPNNHVIRTSREKLATHLPTKQPRWEKRGGVTNRRIACRGEWGGKKNKRDE